MKYHRLANVEATVRLKIKPFSGCVVCTPALYAFYILNFLAYRGFKCKCLKWRYITLTGQLFVIKDIARQGSGRNIIV